MRCPSSIRSWRRAGAAEFNFGRVCKVACVAKHLCGLPLPFMLRGMGVGTGGKGAMAPTFRSRGSNNVNCLHFFAEPFCVCLYQAEHQNLTILQLALR